MKIRIFFLSMAFSLGNPGFGQQMPYGNRCTVEYQKIRNLEYTGWESGESDRTLVVDSLRDFRPNRIRLTRWGGRRDLKKPSVVIGRPGYFRLGRFDGRWYFIDPDGGCLVLMGTQSLGDCAGMPGERQWSRETARLLRENGFNYANFGAFTLKHYSDVMAAGCGERILDSGGRKLAYIDLAYMLRSFVWNTEIDRLKLNRLIAVFHPDYLDHLDRYARENCTRFRDDKHCIGYYLDNELGFIGWRKYFADQTILLRNFLGITDARNPTPLPESCAYAKEAALEFLRLRGVAPDAITEEDEEAFRAYVADYYFRTASEALRRYDPNHLILGSRLHGFPKYDEITVRACARYCDAISINYYGVWTPEEKYMRDLEAWSGGKPFFVTEFYVKGEDAVRNGIPYENREGGGWLVRTQADRGRFYQNFTLHLLRARNCVGWVHFKYRDAVYRNKSGEEAYCNKGIVSVDCQPYTDFLKAMKQVHVNAYALIDYFDRESRVSE